MDLLRRLRFRARDSLRLSPPAWKRLAPRADVERHLDDVGRARLSELASRFPRLARWDHACSLAEWRESLYALDLLDAVLPAVPRQGRCLDVGAKNGCMLAGLATAVPLGWDAVELDAHRRYAWGTTRRAYGERLAAAFEGCRFIAGDVRGLTGPYALVTWFLPFLSPAPVRAWGLPDEVLAPEALLRHVAGLLAPGGQLLVVNQGEGEAELQDALFARCNLPAQPLGRLQPLLSPYARPRYGFLHTREGAMGPPGFEPGTNRL
ncbi:MAG: hypothetical protein RL653_1078 [Pseudomonadota bacterium]